MARARLRRFRFLIDEAGLKRAVLIDLRRHRDLWEDFYDTLKTIDRSLASDPASRILDKAETLATEPPLFRAPPQNSCENLQSGLITCWFEHYHVGPDKIFGAEPKLWYLDGKGYSPYYSYK